MWTLSWGTPWTNPIDEFRPAGTLEFALGLYLHNGFCLVALYGHFKARQYYLVAMNFNVGLWYDTEAELYNTVQYRLWKLIRGD